jgi:hypothetical protein
LFSILCLAIAHPLTRPAPEHERNTQGAAGGRLRVATAAPRAQADKEVAGFRLRTTSETRSPKSRSERHKTCHRRCKAPGDRFGSGRFQVFHRAYQIIRCRACALRGLLLHAAPPTQIGLPRCGRGGIGRRAALRSLWGNPWKFESSRPHQKNPAKGRVFCFLSCAWLEIRRDLQGCRTADRGRRRNDGLVPAAGIRRVKAP